MTTERFTMAIHDLGCGGGGSLTVERALARVSGVQRVYVNPLTDTAYIDGESGAFTMDALVTAVEHAGFRAGQLTRR